MSVWDRKVIVDDSDKNIYIKKAGRGLSLLSKLLSGKKKPGSQKEAMYLSALKLLLDERLLRDSKVNIVWELDLYQRLTSFTDRLLEQKKVRLLQGKCVIGIGGKVNAGKSMFINSLLGSDILPWKQVTCTAIPTYIVKGNEDSCRAYTVNNRDIVLDEEAVQALVNAFYKKYTIGFSNIITNIAINSKDFAYNNIAILDTPGYNNDDQDVMRKISDAEKAFMELSGVDYLIWLIDANEGSITADDLQFIRSLNLRNPPLIVFNQADMMIQADIKRIIRKTEELLEKEYFETLGIIAYSSTEGKEYTGEGRLADFLGERDAEKQNNIRDEMNSFAGDLKKAADELNSERNRKKNSLEKLIHEAVDVTNITALAALYSEIVSEINDIESFIYDTDENMKEINMYLDLLGL